MLKQRIITALVLLAVLLPALFFPAPWVFSALALLLIAAAAWEWGRLNILSHNVSCALAVLCAAACAGAWFAGMLEKPLTTLWIFGGAAWVLVGSWLLYRGPSGWGRLQLSLRVGVGLLALWLAWLAIAQARSRGVEFLLSVLLLVWMADIAAYAAGRTLGRRSKGNHKLAPAISPGKSWEGACGGVLGVLLLALAWSLLPVSTGQSSLYSYLTLRYGLWLMILAVILLASMSVVGDLVESLVKRSAGAKDSSGLLPGHGGVLDRIDALLPTLPLAMMLVSL